MAPYRHFRETTPDERKRLGKEGGITSSHRFRTLLWDTFKQVEAEKGTLEAVIRTWRAGKRSGYDAAYKSIRSGKTA